MKRMGIFLKSILWALPLLSATAFAQSRPFFSTPPPTMQHQTISYRVSINCVLQYTTATSCQDLKDSFFANFANAANKSVLLVRVDNGGPVDLSVKITDEVVDSNNIRYHFIWTSTLTESAGTLPDTPVVLNNSLDALSTLKSISLAASRGLTLFVNIESINFDSEGKWVVVYGKPSAGSTGTPAGWMDRLANSPWYFNGSLNGSGASSGSGNQVVSNAYVNGSAEIAYIRSKVKLDLVGSVSQYSAKLPGATPDTSLSGSYTIQSSQATGVYVLSEHWSVAIINSTVKNPTSNINAQDIVQNGVEWTLVPFRTTENKELAFRLGDAVNIFDLGSPNELGHVNERTISAFAQIYFYWVTLQDRLSFSSTVGLSKSFTYADHEYVNLSGKINYQVTRFLSFNVSGNYGYASKSLTFPRNPDYSNPITSSALTGQAGKSVTYTFGVNFTLGNSTLKQRNRYWSN